MTSIADEYLEHCVKLAEMDKHYAWWAAKNYATMMPWLLADLPGRLKQRMQAATTKERA